MILQIWIIILILSITFLFFGYWTLDKSYMSEFLLMTGWFLMLGIGAILIFDGVEFETGVSEHTTYSYYTDINNFTVVNTTNTSITKHYEAFTDPTATILEKLVNSRIFGLVILMMSIGGFATLWFDRRKVDGDEL